MVVQIAPHASGVRVAFCITHPVKVITHVVAQAVSWDRLAVSAGRLTNKPLRTVPIGGALVRIADIVVANLWKNRTV